MGNAVCTREGPADLVAGPDRPDLLQRRPEPYFVAKVGRARADLPRRHSANDLVGRYVFRDDSTGSDNGALTDLHSRKHHRSAPDPRIVIDLDRSERFRKIRV